MREDRERGTAARPPPPITVSIPGRGPAPAEVLAVGPAPDRAPRQWPRPARPKRLLALGLAVAVLLGTAATLLSASGRPTQPPVATSVEGIEARIAVPVVAEPPADDELVVRLDLTVLLSPPADLGRPGARPQPSVRLVELQGRGFDVRLTTGSLPLVLGPPRGGARFALALEVVVSDCSIGVLQQRRIDLVLQRGAEPQAALPAQARDGVVRALDRLVSTTCRRPRG